MTDMDSGRDLGMEKKEKNRERGPSPVSMEAGQTSHQPSCHHLTRLEPADSLVGLWRGAFCTSPALCVYICLYAKGSGRLPMPGHSWEYTWGRRKEEEPGLWKMSLEGRKEGRRRLGERRKEVEGRRRKAVPGKGQKEGLDIVKMCLYMYVIEEDFCNTIQD